MRAPTDVDDAALAALADRVIAALHDTHPDVRLAREVAIERLRAGGALVEGARLADLGLVWAHLAGDAAAQRAVDRAIRIEAERAARELRQPAWTADEIAQELARRVVVAEHGVPRLASYTGAASLGRWLGVGATRTALNLVRRARREIVVPGDSIVAAGAPGDPREPTGDRSPELTLIRERYRDVVNAAVRDAFGALENPRDRNLLRLYYVERVGLDPLARMFGVHTSTVSRWLTALRAAIFEDTTARLAERLGVDGAYADLESLIRAVRSDLDITLSGLAT